MTHVLTSKIKQTFLYKKLLPLYLKIYYPSRRLWLFSKRSLVAKFSRNDRTSFVDLAQFDSFIHSHLKSINLIRIGNSADGGYLIPDCLENISGCFSPGVGDRVDFEIQLAELGIKSYLIDASVQGLPVEDKRLDFEKKFLGKYSTGVFITLEDWIKRKAPDSSNLLLQMDIEGMEYEVFDQISNETIKKFSVIVTEFHDLHKIFFSTGFKEISSTFINILNNFFIVNIHANNGDLPVRSKGLLVPPLIEVTFLRKDLLSNEMISDEVICKNPLNSRNDTRYKEIDLLNISIKNHRKLKSIP